MVKYDVGGKFDLHYDFAMVIRRICSRYFIILIKEYAHDIYAHLGVSFAEALTYVRSKFLYVT